MHGAQTRRTYYDLSVITNFLEEQENVLQYVPGTIDTLLRGIAQFKVGKMTYQKFRVIIFILISVLFVSCNENFESYFADYHDVNVSGYLAKGWIPEILPDNSYDIREIHNLDNNHVYGAFKYRSDRFDNTIDNLEKVDKAELEHLLQEIHMPKQPAWFMNDHMLTDKKYDYYHYDHVILIVNKQGKQVYFVK